MLLQMKRAHPIRYLLNRYRQLCQLCQAGHKNTANGSNSRTSATPARSTDLDSNATSQQAMPDHRSALSSESEHALPLLSEGYTKLQPPEAGQMPVYFLHSARANPWYLVHYFNLPSAPSSWAAFVRGYRLRRWRELEYMVVSENPDDVVFGRVFVALPQESLQDLHRLIDPHEAIQPCMVFTSDGMQHSAWTPVLRIADTP
ncbi:MAG: hypothetical protein Q9159_005598 [Coniocarpon cinnabarinum]